MEYRISMAVLLCMCVFIVPGIYALVPDETAAQEKGKQPCFEEYKQCFLSSSAPEQCTNNWKSCVHEKCEKPSETGDCRKDIECQRFCTEAFDLTKNKTTTCCEGSPDLSNVCATMVYGEGGTSACLGEGETIEDIRKKLQPPAIEKETEFAELPPKQQSSQTPRIASVGSRELALPPEENKNGLERLMAGIRKPFETLASFARSTPASSDTDAPRSGETHASTPNTAPSSMGVLSAETPLESDTSGYLQSYFNSGTTFGDMFDTVSGQSGNWFQRAMEWLWPGSWF